MVGKKKDLENLISNNIQDFISSNDLMAIFLLKELDKKNPIYLPLIRKAIYTYLNSSAGLENKKIYYKYSDMGNCSEKVLTMN